MRERRVDEVRVQERDQLAAAGRRERPLAEAGAAEAAERDREQRLHELVALVACVRPRVEPDRDAVLHARHDLVDERGPGEEERAARGHEQQPARRRVQHREEDAEVEEAGAEVVRLHEHGHRAAPDQEQRAEVLQPSLCEHLALLAQVAGQEQDQQDLRELARLELEAADADPEAGAVDRPPITGSAGITSSASAPIPITYLYVSSRR